MKKILVIDDDELYLESLVRLFENDYEVYTATSGKEGLVECSKGNYDLIIIDYYLGDINAEIFFDISNSLCNNINVLLLSGKAETDKVVRMLNKSVIDFIDKATPTEIFYTKVKRYLEGNNSSLGITDSLISSREGIELDNDARVIKKGAEKLKVTAKEFLILRYLMLNKNSVMSREDIFKEVWGYNGEINSLRLVDVNILKIRKKTGINSIFSERGVGYVWRETDQ